MDKNIGIFDKDEASSFNVDDLGTTKESNTQIERNYGNVSTDLVSLKSIYVNVKICLLVRYDCADVSLVLIYRLLLYSRFSAHAY